MAISTYKTFLMKKGTGQAATYSKLVDIKSFPTLGGSPEQLETTTLSDGAKTFIPGILSQESLEFKANYTKSDYETLVGLAGTECDFAVWFGATVSGSTTTPTGTDGKFEFKGILSVSVEGGEVNAVVDMTITISPTSAVTLASS